MLATGASCPAFRTSGYITSSIQVVTSGIITVAFSQTILSKMRTVALCKYVITLPYKLLRARYSKVHVNHTVDILPRPNIHRNTKGKLFITKNRMTPIHTIYTCHQTSNIDIMVMYIQAINYIYVADLML